MTNIDSPATLATIRDALSVYTNFTQGTDRDARAMHRVYDSLTNLVTAQLSPDVKDIVQMMLELIEDQVF